MKAHALAKFRGAHASRVLRLAALPIALLVSCPTVLSQILREPFFHCGHGFVSPGRVINCLIASDLPDPEIF